MSKQEVRSFSREFKLRAVQRMEAGENVSALARELSVKRTILYRWRDAWRLGGSDALRLRGRPGSERWWSKAWQQPRRKSLWVPWRFSCSAAPELPAWCTAPIRHRLQDDLLRSV